MVDHPGLGLITSSNFYVPQVNLPGSMALFVTPAGIPLVSVSRPTLHGLAGLGQSLDILGPGTPIADAVVQFYAPWVIGGIVVLLLLARR